MKDDITKAEITELANWPKARPETNPEQIELVHREFG